jgi:hypothetical protein
MTDIVEINGKQYILKDNVAYEIKATDSNTNTKKQTAVNRKEITPAEKTNIIQSMTKTQVKKWFPKWDIKTPLTISATEFWKEFKMEGKNSHYFTHKEKRQFIIPKLIESEKLGKRAIVTVYENARTQIKEKIKSWEKSDRPDIAKQRAIDSLNKELGEYTLLMHK